MARRRECVYEGSHRLGRETFEIDAAGHAAMAGEWFQRGVSPRKEGCASTGYGHASRLAPDASRQKASKRCVGDIWRLVSEL